MFFKLENINWGWKLTIASSTIRKPWQADRHEFEASLGYIDTLYQKEEKKKRKKKTRKEVRKQRGWGRR